MNLLSTRYIKILLNDTVEIDPNLHLKVSVVKSRLALPNSAKLELYNIAEKTYKKLLEEPKVKVFVDDELLFSGKVINAFNDYKASFWLCTVYCSDVRSKPYSKPQYLDIGRGTTNEEVLKLLVQPLSDKDLDTSAFAKCGKAKGSLLKSMVVEYKKEADLMKAIQNQFKDCSAEVVKEDGVVKIQNRNGVPNQAKPLLFEILLSSPQLSHQDIIVELPLNTKVKLGLGFKVKAKSITKKVISPYLYKNQFKDKTYRISEFTHEIDNFTASVAKTTVKGLNYGG